MKLIIKNLSKTYSNGVKALNNVNLTIGKGMFGLLGQNGAGKSSLMRTLATLQDVDHGQIFLGDVDVFKEPFSVRRKLGYLPQDFGVYGEMSAEEMLDYIAQIKGVIKKTERKPLVEYLLHRVNLYEVRNKRLNSYSGGMKQRFGIAQALVGKPDLIVVDEPTAGLDPEERTRFYNILSELGEEAIVILSTHIVEDVTSLCSDMAIIGGGQVLAHASPRQIIEFVEGKIWMKEIDRKDLNASKDTFPVIATHVNQGRTHIHVFGDIAPDSSFGAKSPDMEDAYFAVISGHIKIQELSA
jgi:ABC-type multidrug transport system ATPase subunit